MQNLRATANGPASPPQYPIESVDNALKLILLLGERQEIRLTEVSAYLEVASSTAHRILAMLVWRGFVRQDPASKAYLPGPALTTIAFSVLRKMDLPRLAEPVLHEVSSILGETSHLGVLEGNLIRFLAVSEPEAAVRVASRLGKVMPAHATSTGKVLLAELTEEQLHNLYPNDELEPVTPHSVRTRAELEAQLDEIRRTGYAVNREESEDGVGSVAVAVPTTSGLKIAINASAPIHRLPQSTTGAFARTLQAAAQTFAEILG